MRARTFTIPFTRVGDFPELEFGPDDSLTVRPLFSQDAKTTNEFIERLNSDSLTDETRSFRDREAEGEQIILDLLALCVTEWSLKDGDGKNIPIPKSPSALNKLPSGLARGFFDFFASYRGEGPNPTTGS